jgi:hypothetical protein
VRLALAAFGLALALAGGAEARIPAPETAARAAADASRAQGRNKSFRFDVAVRTNLSEAPIARGELLVAPSGGARIELRHEEGFTERQLRRTSGLAATRDGVPLEDAHPLAPPFWALQAATGGELLTRLGELGGSPAQIALGHDDARDCYVLGGSGGGAAIWVDKDSLQVARVDLADGTKVRFLAWASRAGAILPGTIEIETPELTFTLDLSNAAVATPAADAFADAWLGAR